MSSESKPDRYRLIMPNLHCFSDYDYDYDNDNDKDGIRCSTFF